jgi:hypothetical protein
MIEKQKRSISELSPQSNESESSADKIRLRALVIGSCLGVLICLITPFNNAYRQGTPLGGGYFPLAPFYFLVWMMLITALIRWMVKGSKLITGKELLVSWALMVLLSGIAWTGLARTFFINLTAPYHFATVENRWAEVLDPLLPQSWYPQSQEAIVNFITGFPAEGQWDGWK